MFRNCPRWLVVNVLPQEIHTDDKQDIEFFESLAHIGGPEGQPLCIQWMIARKCQAAMRRAAFRNHGDSKPFGQSHQLVDSVGFLHTAAVLLLTVGAVNGIVCTALVLLSLTALARERARTIGVLRVAGGGVRDIAALLGGAAGAQLALAVPAGFLLAREVLGPAVARLAERYGTLALAPGGTAVVAVGVAAGAIAILTGTIAAIRTARQPIVSLGSEGPRRG